MFAIPGTPPVTMTPRAAAHISKLMTRDEAFGLRIGVKKGGCAGMEYTMEFAKAAQPMDEIIEQDGARILIPPMAQMFRFGTGVGYEVMLPEASFRFRNPNVTDTCGGGESISFGDLPA